MADTGAEPKLVLPQLQSFYDFVIPLAWPIIRIAAGWNLLVHGWGKVMRGPDAFAKPFADMGFASMTWVYGALAIEFVGGIALILGPVHALLGRGGSHRDGAHHVALLEQWIRLAQPRV